MDLYMTEKLTETEDKNQLEEIVSTLAKVIKDSGGEPVEFFFGEGLKTVYSISEVPPKIALEAQLTKSDISYKEVSQVRGCRAPGRSSEARTSTAPDRRRDLLAPRPGRRISGRVQSKAIKIYNYIIL